VVVNSDFSACFQAQVIFLLLSQLLQKILLFSEVVKSVPKNNHNTDLIFSHFVINFSAFVLISILLKIWKYAKIKQYFLYAKISFSHGIKYGIRRYVSPLKLPSLTANFFLHCYAVFEKKWSQIHQKRKASNLFWCSKNSICVSQLIQMSHAQYITYKNVRKLISQCNHMVYVIKLSNFNSI